MFQIEWIQRSRRLLRPAQMPVVHKKCTLRNRETFNSDVQVVDVAFNLIE